MKQNFLELIGRIWLLSLLGLPLTSTFSHAASQVVAWGYSFDGQTNVPPDLSNAVAIACGYSHTLAVRSDGTVTAWGLDNAGQTNVPAGLANAIAVAGGQQQSLALQADGTVVAWGYRGFDLTNVPATLGKAVAIGAGANHDLAVRANGTVVAWGDDSSGQTNVPNDLTNATAVTGGLEHSLALKSDGTVVAWGGDAWGQTNVPVWLANAKAIAAGDRHNLALLANGTVVAWGADTFGQTNVPPDLGNVLAIGCGRNNSMAVKADHTVVVWGSNTYQQTNVPTGLTNVVAATGGDGFTVVLAGEPPLITGQPQDLTVTENSSATFSVTAAGIPLPGYQWRFNGTNISGATASAFTLASARVSDAGSYSVVVSNSLGSQTSADAILTVNQAVVALCTNRIVAAGPDCSANASVDNGSFDPSGALITTNQSPPGPYPLGTNVVTLTVANGSGSSNSCTALVIVLDQTPPSISSPADIVTTNDLNQCGAIVNFPPPTATDNCTAVPTVTCTPPSGTSFPVGVTTVQCVAKDAAGNEQGTIFTVTVHDTQPPTILCPADIVVTNAPGTDTSPVSFNNPLVSDNCPGVGQPVCNPASGSAFGVGTHQVVCTVTDASGNGNQCSFNVTVWPATPTEVPVPVIEISPQVHLPGCTNPTVLACDGQQAAVVCDGSGSYAPQGTSLKYRWLNEGRLFSTNPVAVTSLCVGVHTITLLLDDGLPQGTNSASVNARVISPVQAVDLLIHMVEQADLPSNREHSLLATLEAAKASAARGNLTSCLNQLTAFRNKVRAQVARSNPDQAAILIGAAQEVMDALRTCSQRKQDSKSEPPKR